MFSPSSAFYQRSVINLNAEEEGENSGKKHVSCLLSDINVSSDVLYRYFHVLK